MKSKAYTIRQGAKLTIYSIFFLYKWLSNLISKKTIRYNKSLNDISNCLSIQFFLFAHLLHL